ncbi:Isochorismatase [Pseudoalteromonas luteoviolacea B = ATCC 29581]|nr:Isochorismatase [Pseudoalteromonas luteoviolacea B = ATCC 29581]
MAIPRIASYPLPRHRPENRTTWQLNPDKAVLLVHDMQLYFVNFYDPQAQPMYELVQNIQSLIKSAKAAGIPVIYTAQPANQDPKARALLTDFWGAGLTEAYTAIHPTIAPSHDDKVYTKWRYSAFKRSSLLEDMKIQGRDQLLICGIYAHIGVLSTALDAFMYDIKAFVVADAVADFSESEHHQALQYVAQRCGQVQLLEETVHAMQTQPFANSPLTIEEIQSAIADVMGMDINDILLDENLVYLGLDSIRVMILVDKWRGAGVDINLADLAHCTTVTQWHKVIVQKASVGVCAA